MARCIPRDVWIVDTTLRDGLQASGFNLSPREKTALAAELDAMRVPELEIGFPGAGEQECAWIRDMVKKSPDARLSCWCRALREDVESAARCGVSSVHLSFPVSDRLLNVFNKNRAWLFSALAKLVGFAKKHFNHVSIGMQDASRMDRAMLADFVDAVVAEGGARLRVADTVGILTPAGTAGLIAFIRRRAPVLDIDFHAHNDLGMATANTVAAVEAGATSVNVTVNGIGERAGNARLEEVAVALNLCLGISTGIDETRLTGACRLVAQMSRRPLPPDKPISGQLVFTHESGIHGAAQLKDPLAYQPFPAGRVGRRRPPLRAGPMTGKNILHYMLHVTGVDLPPDQREAFTRFVKEEARRARHPFDSGGVGRLWRQYSTHRTEKAKP